MIDSISIRKMAMLCLPCIAMTACSDSNDNPGSDNGDENVNGKYVFATTVSASSGSTPVLLTGSSLDQGNISTLNNGLKNDGATQWVFHKNYLYGLTYNQGNAGTTHSYILNANGEIIDRKVDYSITRFSSYGTYNDDIITMSTGNGPTQFADSKGYLPKTLLITYIDVINQTTRKNDTSSGAYSMENFLGNGEYVTLAGAEQSGAKLYCGVVPMGLSQYGNESGSWIRPGFEHLLHTESGGSGSGVYNAGELVGTQYPDECWIAIYDNENMLNPTLAKTTKISSPCGRYRSQYYQSVWKADNGDIYVFSSSYSKTMTDPLQRTSLPAGVCRIPAGKTQFDDYYCNIEEQTPGKNRSFMRCWHAGENYFLMQMYDRSLTEKGFAATELAIFDATNKKLTYVTGLPQNVSSIGKTVYAEDNCVYIPVNVENERPAIYRIGTADAVATRGVEIEAAEINGFGYMTPQE